MFFYLVKKILRILGLSQLVKVQNVTPPKTNTQNDGLENVCPFKYGYFGYLC